MHTEYHYSVVCRFSGMCHVISIIFRYSKLGRAGQGISYIRRIWILFMYWKAMSSFLWRSSPLRFQVAILKELFINVLVFLWPWNTCVLSCFLLFKYLGNTDLNTVTRRLFVPQIWTFCQIMCLFFLSGVTLNEGRKFSCWGGDICFICLL